MFLGFDATTLTAHMSGVGYYTARLLESLAGEGASLGIERLVVLSNAEIPFARRPGVEVCERRRFPVRSVWMQAMLPSILSETRPDLVHYTNYLAPILGATPFVVSFHDMSLSLFPQYHTLKKRVLTSSLVPLVARRARRILVPSESTRRDVERLLGVDPGRLHVIPYAAPDRFVPVEGDASAVLKKYGIEPPYFLYVGTIEPRKNIVRVLRAFARASLSDHRLILVGDCGWKYRDVLAEAARPDLAGRVLRLGYAPAEDLPALYSNALAFVYPSLYEGFGFPVLEAMACGAPCLTSSTSSLGEIAEGAAHLVDPTSEDAIVEGLRALAEDKGLRADLRTRGLSRARLYSWSRTARATADVYREVAEEARARR